MDNKINKVNKINKDNNKWVSILSILVLIIILTLSVSLRLSHTDKLIDETNNQFVPTGVDPYYFMRMTEHLKDGGSYQDIDNMRYLGNTDYGTELMPYITLSLYKLINFITQRIGFEIDFYYFIMISPVIYFTICIILLYILVLAITKSHVSSLIASAFFAFTPLLFYRTSAGFYDHEAIGTIFFLINLTYLYLYGNSGKNSEKELGFISKYMLFSLSIVFMYHAWAGIFKVFIIIYPIIFFLYFLSTRENYNSDYNSDYLVDYVITFALVILLSNIGALSNLVKDFVMIPAFVMFMFSIIYIIVNKYDNDKVNALPYSIALTILFSSSFAIVTGSFDNVMNLFNPIKATRVGATIAENSQLNILEIYSYIGIFFTLIFIISCFVILYPIIKKIIDYFKDGSLDKSLDISNKELFMMIILFVTFLILGSTLRMLYVAGIFLSILTGYVINKLSQTCDKHMSHFYLSHGTYGEKFAIYIIFATALIIIMGSLYINYQISSIQSDRLSLSFNPQWQHAMSWVRDNTQEDELFVSWWDYGYFIQTMGQRPTLTDGGHYYSYWDHTMARYLFTTTNNTTAYEFLNTFNASYLLFHPSDIKKYYAISSIANHEEFEDRISEIVPFFRDENNVSKYKGELNIDNQTTIIEIKQTTPPRAIVKVNNRTQEITIRYMYLDKLYDFGPNTDYNGVVVYVPRETRTTAKDNMGAVIMMTPQVYNSFFIQTYFFDNYDEERLEKVYPLYSLYSLYSLNSLNSQFFFYENTLLAPITIYKIKEQPNAQPNAQANVNEAFIQTRGKFGEIDVHYG